MSRVHGWIGLVVGAALVLPVGGVAADTGAVAAVPTTLPSPAASQPRLGFVHVTERIAGAALKAPTPPPIINFAAGEAPPIFRLAAAEPAPPPPSIVDPSAAITYFGFPAGEG